MENQGKWKRGMKKAAWIVLPLLLAIYPLRHINIGLDLWDTGYNYANFTYMGMDHMDPMWLFSTYLSNVVGSFLTKLPFAGNLLGMNFYTGLFVSLLALMGYFFCTKTLKMQPLVVFFGEFLAISLCWCPTALLYNYLTYVLFFGAVILLYLGLTKQKKGCLIAAGLCLGANVLTRFSNLPEAALIVAVWVYDFLAAWEEKKLQGDRSLGKYYWKRTALHTLWCLTGYLSALTLLLGWIAVRYGLDEYVAGILRLFAMTDNATDYKATSMLMGLIGTYVENLYWLIRMVVIALGGMVLVALLRLLEDRCQKCAKACRIAGHVASAGLGVAMLVWLYHRGFASMCFTSYDSMLRPGVLFLMFTMLLGAVRIFRRDAKKEEKLVAGLVILVVLLTSIGSNNGVYPSLNHLFLAAPYALWEVWQMLRAKVCACEKKWHGICFSLLPVKYLAAAFLLMCAFQFAGFGGTFVFAEATGVQDTSAKVDNNPILAGICMSEDKAQAMTQISAYAALNDFAGQEVILYGKVPALSYYLQMPSAFNPWSDLRSYSLETMRQEMEAICQKGEKPVIILGKEYDRLFGGPSVLSSVADPNAKPEIDISSTKVFTAVIDRDWWTPEHEKYMLLHRFMSENGYRKSLSTAYFSVYEAAP